MEIIQATPSQVRRLVDGLRITVDFIRTNIPADVIATRQTHGWKRVNAALNLKPTTTKKLTEIGYSLLWAFMFLTENYTGDAMEIADTCKVLAELGFLKVERTPILPDHPTKQ